MRSELRSTGVLVVEDEPLVAWCLTDMLGDIGVRHVQVACDLDQARELLRESTPRLAILDVNIGSALVFPLAEELHALRVPLVFATGWLASQLPPLWSSRPVLTKPVRRDALAIAIEIACGGRLCPDEA